MTLLAISALTASSSSAAVARSANSSESKSGVVGVAGDHRRPAARAPRGSPGRVPRSVASPRSWPQPTHAHGGLPTAPLTSPDCSGHCSTSRSPTSDSPPSPPGFAPARRSTCARRARSGRTCSPRCSIPMRRSPTARRWWSPPTTSAPATWPAPSARTWRRGGSATTPPGGPGTSRTWRRRRTWSAFASAPWTPSPSSDAAMKHSRATSNEQRATGRRRIGRRACRGGPGRGPAPRGLRPAPRRGGRPRRRRRAPGRGGLRAHRPGRGPGPVRGARRHPRRLRRDRGPRRAAGAVRRRDRVDPLVLDLHPALARRGRGDRAQPGRRAGARASRARGGGKR